MQMTGQRVLPVPPREAWAALNDPDMLKACIPGCESIAATEPLRYELVMAARIGPVAARFKGRLTQSDVVEPESYRIEFDGQGGAAGFGKGSAAVRLSPVDAGTRLDYDVTAQVGGKIAQVGSRLVDSAARKIADDFFACFEAKLAERVRARAEAAPGEAAQAAPPLAAGGPADEAPARPADATRAPAPADAAQRNRWIGWAIGVAVAAVLLWWFSR
jgi:carbon monoxide dehydrogenase subunit G